MVLCFSGGVRRRCCRSSVYPTEYVPSGCLHGGLVLAHGGRLVLILLFYWQAMGRKEIGKPERRTRGPAFQKLRRILQMDVSTMLVLATGRSFSSWAGTSDHGPDRLLFGRVDESLKEFSSWRQGRRDVSVSPTLRRTWHGASFMGFPPLPAKFSD